MPISIAHWSERNAMSATRRGTPMKKVPVKSRLRSTKNATEIIDRLIGDDEELRTLVIESAVNAHIAQLIYDARIAAGLTQAQLAKLAGTRQPVIARLE